LVGACSISEDNLRASIGSMVGAEFDDEAFLLAFEAIE
jgi:hypothetical protein